MNYEKEKYVIEELIDNLSLGGFLEIVQEVCFDKAEHLITNWQDGQGARYWEKIGNLIEKTICKIAKI